MDECRPAIVLVPAGNELSIERIAKKLRVQRVMQPYLDTVVL